MSGNDDQGIYRTIYKNIYRPIVDQFKGAMVGIKYGKVYIADENARKDLEHTFLMLTDKTEMYKSICAGFKRKNVSWPNRLIWKICKTLTLDFNTKYQSIIRYYIECVR